MSSIGRILSPIYDITGGLVVDCFNLAFEVDSLGLLLFNCRVTIVVALLPFIGIRGSGCNLNSSDEFLPAKNIRFSTFQLGDSLKWRQCNHVTVQLHQFLVIVVWCRGRLRVNCTSISEKGVGVILSSFPTSMGVEYRIGSHPSWRTIF